MDVLLTNDDGITAKGLHALRKALLKVPGINLAVVAPNSNRSATARSITTWRPLEVEEVNFADGTKGYATDGTPVDCVRFAQLGLVPGFQAEMVISGINHGANLGDDITYSGTVAAALEGVMLGLPSIAVSQQSSNGEMDFLIGGEFDFSAAAKFATSLVEHIDRLPLAVGTLLNVNVPAGKPKGVEVTPLGKRIYKDQLELHEEEGSGRRLYQLYTRGGHSYHEQPGSDFAAINGGYITVTPLQFELTDQAGLQALRTFNVARLFDLQELDVDKTTKK